MTDRTSRSDEGSDSEGAEAIRPRRPRLEATGGRSAGANLGRSWRDAVRILEARRPESRWRYYGDVRLVPEGMTFFYAHEALRKMWGTTPADADPPEPKAYRRLPAAERDE